MTLLTLYITTGCHLCECADKILSSLSCDYAFSVRYTEIGDDERLVARYGAAVPVIKFADNSELNWPFSAQDVAKKLNLKSNK